MSKKPTKLKAQANPTRARKVNELRRSNAAGTHLDKRTKRSRTRAAQKRNEIRTFD